MALRGTFDPRNPRLQESISEKEIQSFHELLNAGTPILDAIYTKLYQRDGGAWDKIAYALTRNNSLMLNGIAQTPNVWGLPADQVKIGAGKYIAGYMHNLIAGAQQFVDITSLYQFPDIQFMSGIQAALIQLANTGREVTVRILVGVYPDFSEESAKSYLKKLIAPLKSFANGNLTIYAATQRKDLTVPPSWNHAKMVAVDGKYVILGGENQWTDDYLSNAPVHDLNIMLQGPVAFYMHHFADETWKSVCKYWEPDWEPYYWKSGDKDVHQGCLDKSLSTPPKGTGNITVLGAGRYAGLVNDGNPADFAMQLAFQSATSVIRIAQQDLLAEGGLYWEPGMNAIANALVRRLDVFIVISNNDAKSGSGNSYSNTTVQATADAIKYCVSQQPNAPKGKDLDKLLCSKLNLSTLRFGPSDKWPPFGNKPAYEFANHAKFFMIDDAVMYVGSENLYPSNLIEYGVFVSDPAVIAETRKEYWDNLWNYSKRVAISGPSAVKCYFM